MEWGLVTTAGGWLVAAFAFYFRKNDASQEKAIDILTSELKKLGIEFQDVGRKLSAIETLVTYQLNDQGKEISNLRERVHHLENSVTIIRTRCELERKN